MPENQPGKINIRLDDCRFIDFTITPFAEQLSEPALHCEFEIAIGFAAKEESEHINVHILIGFRDFNTKSLYGKISSHFIFYLENFSELIIKKNEAGLEFANIVYVMTGGIALSTTRGMMHMAARNTKLSNLFLPIIDASPFIPVGPIPFIIDVPANQDDSMVH